MRCQTKEELYEALSYQLDSVKSVNSQGEWSTPLDYKHIIRNIAGVNFYDKRGVKHFLFTKRTAIKMVMLKIADDCSEKEEPDESL